MITDEEIEIALDILRPDNTAEAEALYRKIRAEHKAEELRARAFKMADGPIEERKAKAILDVNYQLALDAVASAAKDHRQTQHDKDGAKYIIEIWEQQGHNARAAERVR